MQAIQATQLTFTETERPLGDRLLKLAAEVDRVEGYSEPHAIAIARVSEKLGALLGLHGSDLTALKFAALAHDIGERQTKRNYLLRPGALTWEETLDLWRHPILGEQAAAEQRLPRHAQLLIRWHHEWWNGQGYPDGLAGDAIPLGARIVRAVDSYYALVSTRPHRARFDALEAEQIIADLAGIEFDPLVVKYLLTLLVEERKSRQPETWPGEAFSPPFFPGLEQQTLAEEPAVVTEGAAQLSESAPETITADISASQAETAPSPAETPVSAQKPAPALHEIPLVIPTSGGSELINLTLQSDPTPSNVEPTAPAETASTLAEKPTAELTTDATTSKPQDENLT